METDFAADICAAARIDTVPRNWVVQVR